MGNFWIQFAIQEAISISETVVASSKLTPAQKTALESFISTGQQVLNAFTTAPKS